MRRPMAALMACWLIFAGGFVSLVSAADESAPTKKKVEFPGLGDPGQLQGLSFEYGAGGKLPALRSPDEIAQLAVNGNYSSGQVRDLTRDVKYAAEPAGIVAVSAAGTVTPVADGQAKITATSADGKTAVCEITVQGMSSPVEISFVNEVVPVFTKLGCNSGGCHGKSGGKNGFALSLLGFYPEEDFEYLVKEARGRRLFPAAPDRSLLLLKASNIVAHGGGARMDKESPEYRLIRRWISQGMPRGPANEATLTRIEVLPSQRLLARGGAQQIRVLAHMSDGAVKDVTGVAQYEPNDTEMAEVTKGGVVKSLDLTGDVAVMARYNGAVGVFRASIPMGIKVTNLPAPNNFVDEIVFKKLTALGVPPSAVCDDATFLRRLYVDLTGRLPSKEETEAFLADQSPAKRNAVIDRLLASSAYADYFANKWNAVLRNKKNQQAASSARASLAFHAWIRESFHQNKPYDEFVREILASSGDFAENPGTVWFRNVTQINEQVEDTAQLFLGLRIQCARCHHHPFEKWSQRDYYGFQAFFAQVGRKQVGQQQSEARIYHKRGEASATNPRGNEKLKPTGLGSDPMALADDDDPRQSLVDWMSAKENPFFAKALVNRYWKHLFGRGLVDPEDDMRETNPPANPELLDALAKSFIDSKFDMKGLLRTICQSKVYQLSSEPNEYNVNDKQNFSRYYPKRLNAEVLLDAINLVTKTNTAFGGVPGDMRAVQLPDPGANNYFLTVFGKPQGESACECERSSEANLAQSLHLINSQEIQGKLSAGGGRSASLAGNKDMDEAAKIRELYLWCYSRLPQPEEVQIALAHVQKHENKQVAFEDILWALINTKEFLFNH